MTPRMAFIVLYVTDHRTGAWVRADHAVYTRVAVSSTPMGTAIVAHDSPASRTEDVVARDGSAVAPAEALPLALIGGSR